ncbi:MAG TPA: phosphatase PAP2 family protein [Polyangiaceae bacterium]|jgi:membrane-associated phospholipid phosphatase|nr:phosphatase PAP2 family protein [Polyangiaceae bacterium]
MALCFTLFVARSARAEQREPEQKEAEHRMQWNYPRFHLLEYAAAGLVTGVGFWLAYGTRGKPDNGIDGPILLDGPSRDLFLVRDMETRKKLDLASDLMWHSTQYFPVVDSIVTPLASDNFNIDVATQMMLINWEVMGTAFFLTRATHRLVGRTRPVLQDCEVNPEAYSGCDEPQEDVDSPLNSSFLSGHASLAFAGASLTCAHHTALPLYGGNAGDAIVCAMSLASASTVAMLRVMVDAHWWSDVMAGAMLGSLTGWGLPYLLHYAHPLEVKGVGKAALIPIVSPDTIGLSVGVF